MTGRLRPDTRLHEYAAEAYDEQLQTIRARLHQLADATVKRGTTLRGTRTDGARAVIAEVLFGVANLGLDQLVLLAQQADPPADTPAVLLDRAITGLLAAADALDATPSAADAEALAEGALRGAGVLR